MLLAGDQTNPESKDSLLEKEMTLKELKQVKADVDNGIMVSKSTWLNVLEWAITLTEHHETGKGPKNACDD